MSHPSVECPTRPHCVPCFAAAARTRLRALRVLASLECSLRFASLIFGAFSAAFNTFCRAHQPLSVDGQAVLDQNLSCAKSASFWKTPHRTQTCLTYSIQLSKIKQPRRKNLPRSVECPARPRGGLSPSASSSQRRNPSASTRSPPTRPITHQ